jgi:PhnB protein
MANVKPIPDTYPQVTAYLCIDGAAEAIDFYSEVLGASQRGDRMIAPDGKIGHAELAIGDSLIMLSDEFPEEGVKSPMSLGGSPITMSVYVEDVDAVFARAVAVGGTETQPLKDQFYGDRSGQFEDPFGHRWSVATHVEDVSPEEMQRRAREAMGA